MTMNKDSHAIVWCFTLICFKADTKTNLIKYNARQ